MSSSKSSSSNQSRAKELMQMDLYAYLGLEQGSDLSEIRTAYRKKARIIHPDKNKDNPNAGLDFHLLSEVLALFEDEAARKAYDKVFEGRKQREARNLAMDSKRLKMREELEERERQANERVFQQRAESEQRRAEADLLCQMQRIERQMAEQLELERQELLRAHRLHRQTQDRPGAANTPSATQPTFRVRWCAKFPHHKDYDEISVKSAILEFGKIKTILFSTKRPGFAVVEMEDLASATLLYNASLENKVGHKSNNPLQFEWVECEPSSSHSTIGPPSSDASLTQHQQHQSTIPDRKTLETFESELLSLMMNSGNNKVVTSKQ